MSKEKAETVQPRENTPSGNKIAQWSLQELRGVGQRDPRGEPGKRDLGPLLKDGLP